MTRAASGRDETRARPPRSAVILAILAILATLVALAVPAEGEWTPAPPPVSAVYGSIQLPDGKVLVAEDCPPRACWQLFDPLRGDWSVPGLLGPPSSRTDTEKVQTLIGLPNGQALVTLKASGGRKFRYNGAQWVSLPPEESGWTHIRTEGASTTLLNPPPCQQPVRPVGFEDYPCDAVLFAGGFNSPQRVPYNGNWEEVPFTADLYTYDGLTDPGRLLPLARMPQDHPGHKQGFTILLDDGRVVVAGGTETPGGEVLFFDPLAGETDEVRGHRRGAWTYGAPLPHAILDRFRPHIWTVRLPGSRPRYLIGGGSEARPVVFDPADGPMDMTTGKPKGLWTAIDHCTTEVGVDCSGGVLRPDGTVFVVTRGGHPLPVRKTLVLDPRPSDQPTEWRWTEVLDPWASPEATLNTAVLLDGAGKPEQCGANCGLVLAAGFSGFSNAGIGTAQLFGTLLEVTGVSPPEGPACGGRRVKISGRGLDRATSVNFGTERVDQLTRNPDGSITVASPRHAPGAVPVTVSTAGGAATTKASANAIFTYTPVEPPRVTGLSTGEGRADRRTPVTINGSFPVDCVRGVTFGGGEATFAPPGPTAIKATSPTGTPGTTVPVEVLYDPGPPTAADSPVAGVAVPPNGGVNLFTYRALPDITGVPGISALGGAVAISGTNFEPDAADPSPPNVTFDGVTRAAAKATATRVDVTAPPMAPGRLPGPGAVVTVETVKRGRSEPAPFNYHPGVLNISPPSGFITGGESRVITGAGLRDAEVVLIGGQEAKILDRPGDGRSLVVSTPARPEPESVPVEVIVAGLASLETVYFNYGDPAGADPPAGDPDPGPALRQGNTPQAAPPGGTGSPASSPSASAAPSPSPVPGASAVASGSGSGSSSASSASAQAPTTGSAQSPAGAGAAGAAAAPSPGPAAAPASAAAGTGSAGSGGPSGAGSDDEADEARTMPRHNMTAANIGVGLGGAGAAMCFSGLALARRRRSARSRPRPRGAY